MNTTIINAYATSLLSSINFVHDWRFSQVEEEFAEVCEHNLIEYLKILIEIYQNSEDKPCKQGCSEHELCSREDVSASVEDTMKKINEKKEELLGEPILGSFSELVISEALYYYRLMMLPDRSMHQLIHLINSYNEFPLKVIRKINSLIMFNICTFGAGTTNEKPLFNLSIQEGISKEQKDLEVSIMFLLRNINDLHLTLAEPIYGHPLDTLLVEDDVKEPEPEPEPETKPQLEDGLQTTEEVNEKDFGTKIEKTIFIGSIFTILIVMAYLISNVSTIKSMIKH